MKPLDRRRLALALALLSAAAVLSATVAANAAPRPGAASTRP